MRAELASAVKVAAMKLNRRWLFAIAILVIAVAAVALSQAGVFGRSSAECGPVKDLLEFNKSESTRIASKTGDSQGVPNVGEDALYQAWVDGLIERAQKVTAPDLAATATQVASLANEFVGKFPELRAESASRAPGAPAPAVAFQMEVLNTQITENLKKLSDACS